MNRHFQKPSWLRERHRPEDAMRLLIEPERVHYACNVIENPAFHKADGRTRGADGRRVVDAYRERKTPGWADEITCILQLPIEEFRASLPPLAIRTINEAGAKVPWGPWDEDDLDEDELAAVGLIGTGKERVVAKPCPTRRMLDNAFEQTLVVTINHRLSRSAWAYRPGKRDAVREVIVGVQKAIVNGQVFWAKLDIKAFFPSMPWNLIENSLRTAGYPEEFVRKVMAMVQVPLVDERRRTIQPTMGSQAGTRISGIVANLALQELDALVERRLDENTSYWRYSDDLIVMGADRGRVEKIVTAIRGWMNQVGLALKKVGRAPVTRLVHHVDRRRVEVLGAHVNREAVAGPAPNRYDALLARIAHRAKFTALPDEPIEGISNYAHVDGPKGRYVFDERDLADAVSQFRSFWDPINRGLNKTFQAALSKRLGREPPSGIVPERTWVAILPSEDARPARGPREDHPGPRSTIRAGSSIVDPILDDPLDVDLEALTRDQDHGQGDRTGGGLHVGAEEGECPVRDVPGPRCPCGVPIPSIQERIESVISCEGEEQPMGVGGVSPEQVQDDEVDSSGLHQETIDKAVEEYIHSLYDAHIAAPHGAGEAGQRTGGVPGPSPRPVSQQLRIETRLLQGGGVIAVVVGDDGRVRRSGPRRGRDASAILALLLTEVDRAAAASVDSLEVSLPTAWLAKALVQRTRRFRMPALFDLVLRLHDRVRDSGVELTLIGGGATEDICARTRVA